MALGPAIQRCKGRITQTEIAQSLGVTQSTVSKWIRGEATPTLDQLALIEITCSRPRGFILRQAGYVDDVVDVETALAVDPIISDDARDLLTVAYRGAVSRANGRPAVSD